MNNPFSFFNNKDTRTEGESRKLQVRTAVLIALFCCILLAFFGVLYNLQVVKGDYYLANANHNIAQTETVDSVRGGILDRYGRVLVTNQASYQVTLNTTLMGDDRNEIIAQLLALCRESGVTWADSLPITPNAPWRYTRTDNLFSRTSEDEEGNVTVSATSLGRLAQRYKWISDPATADPSAAELLTAICLQFGLIEHEGDPITAEMRAVAGVLYEVYLRSNEIVYTDYILASDVDITFITRIKERSLTGVTIKTATSRQYNTTYAAHVLGHIGSIQSQDWPAYRELGYPMNAYVGRSGVELAFESYLHGTSGVRQIETDENGKLVSQQWLSEPGPGDNVVLTLDLGLQAVTEDLLAQFVSNLEEPGGAAAVVVDMTGGVLAMASYPTYAPAEFLTNYNELLTAENRPMFNRATMGLYAPGSTFKMVTAVAALSEGVVTPYSTVYCGGIYHYADAHPRCWIASQGGIHATENVSQAITDSCNIYFYDVGRRLGITALERYAAMFGLGQYTGIEIPEYKGTVAGPETSAAYGQPWYGGDTLYASIGQGNNQFTPLQLANYVATLVNGGNHYQAHLLKEVKSSDYSQVVFEHQPVLLDSIHIDSAHLAAVKRGMYDLSKTAGMAYHFSSLPVEVGCKTGTAEVSGKDATATFVCFAPYDDPQIAICLVAEQGSSGGNLASVAAGILAQYFSTDSSLSAPTGENTLLH